MCCGGALRPTRAGIRCEDVAGAGHARVLDSGSLLLDADFRAVGLLLAGSPMVTIHNHIGKLAAALGVRVVTAF